jgi:hypothetical protein
MADTTFIDGSPTTPIVAAWLNDVNLLTYHLCGDGVLAAPTRAQLITNLGLITAADIASIYLTQADAASTYLTQTDAATTYLTISDAASTYSTTTDLSSYLTIATAASTYAPIASPTFTGDPKAPTPSPGDNDTSIATTAFVTAAITAAAGTGLVLGTPQDTTSGTSIDFTGIPNTVKLVRVILDKVEHDVATNILLRIGGTGAIETSGYTSGSSWIDSTTGVVTAGNGFVIHKDVINCQVSGTIILSLLDFTNNIWGCTGSLVSSVGGVITVAGVKTITGGLTKVSLTSVGAVANFNNGSMNIQYES